MKADLTILSDCVVDIYFKVGRFPSGGDALIGELYCVTIGGACTVAATASKLGLKVLVVDKIGDDVFGETLLKQLRSLGVNTQNIEKVKGEHTSIVVVLLGERGEHAYVGSLGPSLPLNTESLKRVLAGSHSLFLDGYALLKMDSKTKRALTKIIAQAKRRGLIVFFDPGPVVDSIGEIENFVEQCDVVFVNGEESIRLRRILGCHPKQISEKNTTLVVKEGSKGATLFWRGSTHHFPTIEAGGYSVGAGDVFDAAYIWATLRGFDPQLCCVVGNAAAHLKMRGVGTDYIPTLGEIAATVEKMGYNMPANLGSGSKR